MIARTCRKATLFLLIIEDDVHYARILCDLSHDNGFKVLVAIRGTEALALAREFHPTRHIARCASARHARLDCAEPPEAGSMLPATSRSRC